jgi:hypothetical protein
MGDEKSNPLAALKMPNQFAALKGPGGLLALEQKILGPSYDYASHIKSPEEMGMSGDGNFGALADNVSGILGYVDVLIGGHCTLGNCASKYLDNPDGTPGDTLGKPLGNQFFLDTAVQCKDKATGKKVTRSIYVNNVPDGQIPFVSNMGGDGMAVKDMEGIMPGIMSNIAQIRPMQILMAFVSGGNPTCQTVTMPIVNATTNAVSMDHRYITNSDISIMPKAWFPDVDGLRKSDYDYKEKKSDESFRTMDGTNKVQAYTKNNSTLKGSKIDYSKMPNDVVIKFYFSMLGLVGLYILLKLMLKKKIK